MKIGLLIVVIAVAMLAVPGVLGLEQNVVVGYDANPFIRIYDGFQAPPANFADLGGLPPTDNIAGVKYSNDILVVYQVTAPRITAYDMSVQPPERLGVPSTQPGSVRTGFQGVLAANSGTALVCTGATAANSQLASYTIDQDTKTITFFNSIGSAAGGSCNSISAWEGYYAVAYSSGSHQIRSGDPSFDVQKTFTTSPAAVNVISIVGREGGLWIATGHVSGEFLQIRDWDFTTDIITKIDSSAIGNAPTSAVSSLAWNEDGSALFVGQSATPRAVGYERSGSNYVRLDLPDVDIPAAPTEMIWGPDASVVNVAHASSPFFTRYQFAEGGFVKLANPSVLPTATARSIGVAQEDILGPTPPQGLSIRRTGTCETGPSSCDFDVRFPLSASDTDSINGDFTYKLYVNGIHVGTMEPESYTTFSPGIVEVVGVFGITAGTYTFKVSAVNLGSAEGPQSCGVLMNLVTQEFAQCGVIASPFAPPVGPSAPPGLAITSTAQGTSGCVTGPATCPYDIRWKLSPSDPNQTAGELSYRVFVNGINVGTIAPGAYTTVEGTVGLVEALNIFATSAGTYDFQIAGLNEGVLGAKSCTVRLNLVTQEFNHCGNLIPFGDPSVGIGVGPGGGPTVTEAPQFIAEPPEGGFFDTMIESMADGWGLAKSGVRILVGLIGVALVVGAFARMGGGPLLIGVGVVLGTVGMVMLGLLSVWILLLMILIVALMVGNRFFGGNGKGDSE